MDFFIVIASCLLLVYNESVPKERKTRKEKTL